MVASYALSLALVATPAWLAGCGDAADHPTTTTTTTSTTLAPCVAEKMPAQPSKPDQYNGEAWPTLCVDANEGHFFGIGDWGGYCNWVDNVCTGGEKVRPMPTSRKEYPGDKDAQQQVAAAMKARAQNTAPDFILSLGDHFYPGGVDIHCGSAESATYQFENMFEAIYDKKALGTDWMAVLGNHDYGGSCFVKGWDQQITYTWSGSGRWVMPAQYWKRRVQFARDFAADFFFVDTNLNDVEAPDLSLDTNLCSRMHNEGQQGSYCPEKRFPPPAGSDMAHCKDMIPSIDKCVDSFNAFWTTQRAWLEDELSKSTATWQIVVTHHPAMFPPEHQKYDLWPLLGKKYGIDLMISGHTHDQKLYVGDNSRLGMDMSDFPYVVSGGGGGIFSEHPPSDDGDDDEYGFVHFRISKDAMDIVMVSRTGIERDSKTIHPRQPASQVALATVA